MRSRSVALPLFVVAFLLQSCIRSEAPNSEADIVSCTIPGATISGDVDYFAMYDSTLRAYPLVIEIDRGDVDLKSLAPVFELTPGATITPGNGSRQDFSRPSVKPVRYTVTSEDGKWKKVYSVNIRFSSIVTFPEVFSFEDADTKSGYFTFHDGDLTWCSGNRGFRLTNTNATPDEYPTGYSSDGYRGGCVIMTTRTTGSLGSMGGMPIAAGSIFLGTFDGSSAMSDALAATKFGVPYTKKPIAIEGWFRYMPGPQFLKDGEYIRLTDTGNINAVLYERMEGDLYLDGHTTADGWTDSRIIALASMPATPIAEEWTKFHIDFDYDRYGHEFDAAKLASGRYGISLIFSSSAGGGQFEGAPGSTLMIDEVRIINEK